LYNKLKEYALDALVELETLVPRQPVALGPFEVEPFRVAH
jgi:hypothetical protein